MFNFFDELKKKTSNDLVVDFNLVNISGKLLYVEGHLGLTILSQENIVFKVKSGRVVVEGENLYLSELTNNTMLIKGNIIKVEQSL